MVLHYWGQFRVFYRALHYWSQYRVFYRVLHYWGKVRVFYRVLHCWGQSVQDVYRVLHYWRQFSVLHGVKLLRSVQSVLQGAALLRSVQSVYRVLHYWGQFGVFYRVLHYWGKLVFYRVLHYWGLYSVVQGVTLLKSVQCFTGCCTIEVSLGCLQGVTLLRSALGVLQGAAQLRSAGVVQDAALLRSALCFTGCYTTEVSSVFYRVLHYWGQLVFHRVLHYWGQVWCFTGCYTTEVSSVFYRVLHYWYQFRVFYRVLHQWGQLWVFYRVLHYWSQLVFYRVLHYWGQLWVFYRVLHYWSQVWVFYSLWAGIIVSRRAEMETSWFSQACCWNSLVMGMTRSYFVFKTHTWAHNTAKAGIYSVCISHSGATNLTKTLVIWIKIDANFPPTVQRSVYNFLHQSQLWSDAPFSQGWGLLRTVASCRHYWLGNPQQPGIQFNNTVTSHRHIFFLFFFIFFFIFSTGLSVFDSITFPDRNLEKTSLYWGAATAKSMANSSKYLYLDFFPSKIMYGSSSTFQGPLLSKHYGCYLKWLR